MLEPTYRDLLEEWRDGSSLDAKLGALVEMRRAGYHIVAMADDLGVKRSAMILILSVLDAVDWDRKRLTVEQRRRIMRLASWEEGDVSIGRGYGPPPGGEPVTTPPPAPAASAAGSAELRALADGKNVSQLVAPAPAAPDAEAAERMQKLVSDLRAGFIEPSPKNLALLDERLGLPRARWAWRARRFGEYYGRKATHVLGGYVAAWLVYNYVGTWPAMFAGVVVLGAFCLVMVLLSHLPAGKAPTSADVARDYAGAPAAPLPTALTCPHCHGPGYFHRPEDCPLRPEAAEPEPPPPPDVTGGVRVELVLHPRATPSQTVAHIILPDGVGEVRQRRTVIPDKDEFNRYVERHEVDESEFADFYDANVIAVENYVLDGRLLTASDPLTPRLLELIPRTHKTAVVRALKEYEATVKPTGGKGHPESRGLTLIKEEYVVTGARTAKCVRFFRQEEEVPDYAGL